MKKPSFKQYELTEEEVEYYLKQKRHLIKHIKNIWHLMKKLVL